VDTFTRITGLPRAFGSLVTLWGPLAGGREEWVEGMYKYNSAARSFQRVPSRSFTVMTDGFTLDLSTLRRVAKDMTASH
jgi:hypothetical protein